MSFIAWVPPQSILFFDRKLRRPGFRHIIVGQRSRRNGKSAIGWYSLKSIFVAGRRINGFCNKMNKPAAPSESAIADGGDGIGDGNGSEPAANRESMVTDGGDGIGDGDRGEASAITESTAADGGDGIGDGDGGEAVATRESIVTDGGDGIGNSDRCKITARRESIVTNGSDRIGDGGCGDSFMSSNQSGFCIIGINQTVLNNTVNTSSPPRTTCGTS